MGDFFENRYFNTYYYSNIVDNILTGDLELLGFISNFFADEGAIFHLAKPFQKTSAFHCFIQHIVWEFFEEDMGEYDPKNFGRTPYADLALKQFGMGDYTFKDFIRDKGAPSISYDDVEAYHDELRLTGTLEELYEKIAVEVFYVLSTIEIRY